MAHSVACEVCGEQISVCFDAHMDHLRKCGASMDNVDVCTWRPGDEDVWATWCGHHFQFFDGGPFENEFHHCPYCGKRLLIDEP